MGRLVIGQLVVGLGVVVLVIAVVLVATWLVLRRPDIPFEKLEAKYAVPTSHYVDLGEGVRVHYRDDGDPKAPVIVLVHGFGDSFLTWEGWIKALSPHYRVITLDLPGHGLTRAPATYAPEPDRYADLIDAFAAKLDLPPFAIAGNSMGGGVAWRFALRHPQRLTALVLVDAAGWAPPANSPPPPLAFKVMQSGFGKFLLKTIETRPLTAQGLKADVVDQSLITPAFVDRWVEVQRAPGHRPILMAVFTARQAPATKETLAKITTPTLVLWGEQDHLIPVANAKAFADAIGGAKLIIYPDAGHLPQFENPTRSAGDVDAFLKGLAK
ncbi:pimeloyl-ACP methyl ester carboxylesterase [Caulobacter ginsengisoli]|uniref:Pimeloyl-ACP methyl ester carboxylesterase n=1 Tax=Caulobacter ginsengisoli TaxID=400775 RepID=A0ABU0IRE1_9CAUL|nr:alpha/beta hydrolase [Caulobacter ginsengisoli]MDQ0464583.1 pimeloyl-ACP methyl ester carboxylesterase [Caulobacter ginsengisoli]